MIKLELTPGREYSTECQYDVTDVPRLTQFLLSPDGKTFRVFNQNVQAKRFLSKESNQGWKKLGTVKFAVWERPETFYHFTHSNSNPNKKKNSSVTIHFSEEGYNLVKISAGDMSMAAWIRSIIAEKLNVKPKDLFAYDKTLKRSENPTD